MTCESEREVHRWMVRWENSTWHHKVERADGDDEEIDIQKQTGAQAAIEVGQKLDEVDTSTAVSLCSKAVVVVVAKEHTSMRNSRFPSVMMHATSRMRSLEGSRPGHQSCETMVAITTLYLTMSP